MRTHCWDPHLCDHRGKCDLEAQTFNEVTTNKMDSQAHV